MAMATSNYDLTNGAELLQWDGSIVMDGVRGGSDGAMLRRFDTREGNTAYDQYIHGAFTKTRMELKRVQKLWMPRFFPSVIKSRANWDSNLFRSTA